MKRITKTKYINLKNILSITLANILLNTLITKSYAAVDLAHKNTFDTPVIKVLVLAIGISLIILILFGASQQDTSTPRKVKMDKVPKERKNTNNSNTMNNRIENEDRADFNKLNGEIKENFDTKETLELIEVSETPNMNEDINVNKIEIKTQDDMLDANEVIKSDGLNFNAGENENAINLEELEVETNVESEPEPEKEEKKTRKPRTTKTTKTTKRTKKTEPKVEEAAEVTEDDLTNEFLKNMDKMLKK